MEFLNKGFDYHKGLNFHHKGIRCVDDIWDNNQQNFHTWERAQKDFRLTNTNMDNWIELTNKISE